MLSVTKTTSGLLVLRISQSSPLVSVVVNVREYVRQDLLLSKLIMRP